MILGLVLGLLPEGALLLSPDGAALSWLAKQLEVDPEGDGRSWPGITCEATPLVSMQNPVLIPLNCMLYMNHSSAGVSCQQNTVEPYDVLSSLTKVPCGFADL